MSSISSHNSHFTIVFDAVGTLIYARPTVAEAYQAAATRFGWSGSASEIETRFRTSFVSLSGRAHDLKTDEALQRLRWRELVGNVFHELSATQVDDIFEALWIHFAQPSSWAIYPDALAAIELCNERNIPWCIGSNFDARLHQVLAGHPELSSCHRVFCSSEVGFDKPAVDFFHTIEQCLGLSSSQLLMIGDDPILDATAAEQAGWIGLHLNRDAKTESAIKLDGPPQLNSLADIEPWLL